MIPTTTSKAASVAAGAAAAAIVSRGGSRYGYWATAQPQTTAATASTATGRTSRVRPVTSRTSAASPDSTETTTSGSPRPLVSSVNTGAAVTCSTAMVAAASAPETTPAASARRVKYRPRSGWPARSLSTAR